MSVIDPVAKGAQVEKYTKWGMYAAAGLFGYLTYNIALIALQGLILWSAVAGVALLIANFAPAVGAWAGNKRLQVLKAVVEANPIETLQNLFADKSAELREKEENITDFDTELSNFSIQIKKATRELDSADDVRTYQEIEGKMKEVLTIMRSEQSIATEALSALKGEIRRAQILYDLAKAGNKMLEASQSAQAAVYASIKESVAFDKVQKDVNRVFANLNTAVERRKNVASFGARKETPALPEATSVIDLGNVRAPSKLRVN